MQQFGKQPDQNNSNGKLKYYSNSRHFEQPLFKFYQNSLDPLCDSTKTSSNQINTNTQYTRNIPFKKNILSNTVESGFDNKYFPKKEISYPRSTIGDPRSTMGDPRDRANKIDIESQFKLINNKDTRDVRFEPTHDRRRNLDYSDYIPAGSKANAGFGNIIDFSKIKYGESTRIIETQESLRDKELDRFYPTFRNYQHEVYGSNPYPKDTRYLNKKY